jgi:hypothetical protein
VKDCKKKNDTDTDYTIVKMEAGSGDRGKAEAPSSKKAVRTVCNAKTYRSSVPHLATAATNNTTASRRRPGSASTRRIPYHFTSDTDGPAGHPKRGNYTPQHEAALLIKKREGVQ